MKPYLVKLPVFELEGGVRGIMVAAQLQPTGQVLASLFCDNGVSRQLLMDAYRVKSATRYGPFVVLAEVKDIGERGLDEAAPGIVGPDGNPIT